MSPQRVTSIGARPKPVHLRSFTKEARTFCGRVASAVDLAREMSDEATCRRCIARLTELRQAVSKSQLKRRNRIEDRAKACFEIVARVGIEITGDVWEAEDERMRQAFRDVVDFMEDLGEEDADDRSEEPE
jgi:DUF438 domain-containing protein